MGKPSPPASPDYAGAAQAQGAANLESAIATGKISNPNVISPYGTQTVYWGGGAPSSYTPGAAGGTQSAGYANNFNPDQTRTVNFLVPNPQTGLRELQSINLSASDLQGNAPQQLQDWLAAGAVPYTPGGNLLQAGGMVNGGQMWVDPTTGQQNSLYNIIFPQGIPGSSAGSGISTTGAPAGGSTDALTPTIVQTLNPISQQSLNEQQLAGLKLSQLANTQAGAISNLLNNPYQIQWPIAQQINNPNNPGVWVQSLSPDQFQQTSGAGSQYANPQTNPNLFGFGQAQTINPTQYGPISPGNVAAPNLQLGIDTSGVAQMPVNAGTTAQQAIMSRLQPQLERDRASLVNQLTQQGLVPGEEAYNNAMTLLNQQQNDQRTQAALQGLNLDLAANQQGFGQAAQQGAFANQAQLANFGAGLQNTQAYNQSQQQAYNQALGAAGFNNAAIQANQQTALAQQNAYNQAIAQGFSQQQAMQAAQNAAVQQNFTNYLQQQQAQNAAQQQQYNQALQSTQFQNQAQQQYNAELMQQQSFPVNLITALMSGGQVTQPQFPGYQGATVAPAPLFSGAQAQGQYNTNLYNTQMAGYNSMLGGLFGLGTAGIGGIFGLGK